MQRILSYIFLLLFSLFLLSACSVEKKNFVSLGYHNTCLRYNKYFLADLKVKEVEQKLWDQHKDDYNNILLLYPDVDTNIAKGYKTDIDDILKKASMGIAWHKNSRWVDDAYILIGKARLYSCDFKNAQETFKYVNTKSENPNDRHTALIWLMQKFIRNKELYQAKEVYSYLLAQKLNKKNKLVFYQTAAYYHEKTGEYPQTAVNLEDAIPNFRFLVKREKKARLYFIIGQIYQKYGRDSLAQAYYEKCIKNNPPYELSFYSKLYYAQVASINDPKADKKITSYFKKLLKDPKNAEYKDKIYYEMALYEYKQGHEDKTIALLNKSVHTVSTNTIQKGYSYLKLGDIYYEDRQAYLPARNYYDSTLSTLPKDHPKYKDIQKRKLVLDDFVKYFAVVQVEDSLQKLAKMDSLALNGFVAKYIDDEYAQRKSAWETAQKAAKKKRDAELANVGTSFTTPSSINFGGDSKWYFYNGTAVAAGQQAFLAKWGQRRLEDNWRRAVKDNAEAIIADQNSAPDTTVKTVADVGKKKKANEFEGQRLDKSSLIAAVPLTPEKLAVSDGKIQEAYFKLGKLYYVKLEEPQNGINMFRRFDARYDSTRYSAEVLYSLYYSYDQQQKPDSAAYYRNQLLTRFPKSDFAQFLKNPNYKEENRKIQQAADRAYENAYTFFKFGQYHYSDSLLTIVLKDYPDYANTDKIMLLKAMIVGRTSDIPAYTAALKGFGTAYPKSPLKKNADDQLKGVEEVLARQAKTKERMDSLPDPPKEEILPADSPASDMPADTHDKKPPVQDSPLKKTEEQNSNSEYDPDQQ